MILDYPVYRISWAFTASVEGKDMGVNFGGVINGAKELSAADYRA
jgi:hypothetical protein